MLLARRLNGFYLCVTVTANFHVRKKFRLDAQLANYNTKAVALDLRGVVVTAVVTLAVRKRKGFRDRVPRGRPPSGLLVMANACCGNELDLNLWQAGEKPLQE
jgi:hypothetical protein